MSQTMTYCCYAIPGAPSWWPRKLPAASLDYSLDISCAVDPSTDIISFVEAACAPSGSASELQISDLTVSGTILTLNCASGVPTRVYTISFLVSMVDGRTYEFLVYQGIPPGLPGYSVPYPLSPTYGTAITWSMNDEMALESGAGNWLFSDGTTVAWGM